MRALGISTISLALTAAVISNAYYQKKQFYPAVVYITKSNPSMAVIYVQSLVMVLLLGKLMRKVFLGTLRAAEFEHLMERFWYALTETCLAFTVFRDDFNSKFVAMFTVLLFLKSFHWLAEDRVDYMERSPVIGLLFYIRVSALLLVLGTLDSMMISHAYHATILKGPTVQLVFGFEYAVLITMVANTTIKYVLHSAEMRAESPWENKAVFLLYTELVIGFIRVVLYILFVIIMVKIYTLPLFAFRPMYYTMRNFKKAFNDVILSRRAIRNMNTLYPDATAEELSQSDNICIICREDMITSAKKLPCGHIFHTACLRSWFQRQQTCPTCRLNILRTTPVTPQHRAAGVGVAAGGVAGPAGGAAAAAAGGVGGAAEAGRNVADVNNPNNQPNGNVIQQPIAGIPNPFALPPLFQFPMINNNNNNINNNNNNNNNVPGSAAQAGSAQPIGAAFLPPPPPSFPFLSPYMLPPPPPMPAQLDTLTDDELRALEGNERHHVEERIKLLRNIQLLMDASSALMNQYTTVAARFPPPQPTSLPPMPMINSNQLFANFMTAGPSTSAAAATVAPSLASGGTTDNVTTPNVQQQPQPSTSNSINISETAPMPNTSNASNNQATDSGAAAAASTTADSGFVKIEDLGSEEHMDINKSTANTANAALSSAPLQSATASTSASSSVTPPNETAEAAELRRRRLQKFLKSERNE